MRFVSLLALSLTLPLLAVTPQEKTQKAYDDIVDLSPVTLTALTAAQRDELFAKVSKHPVAKLVAVKDYDHQPTGIGNREVGFCYGRAMTVHLTARKMGLSNDSIQKIYIGGDLNNGAGTRWRFHMATMVKGDDGLWYVIDPIMPGLGKTGVIRPYEWMKTIKDRYDLSPNKDRSQFYVTDIRGIMVEMRLVPAHAQGLFKDRLIDPKFEPAGLPGFERVELQADASPYPVHRVTGDAQLKYFINRDEPAGFGGEVDDFDFYSLSIVISFEPPGTTVPDMLTRSYHYNNYFANLLDSYGGAIVPPPVNESPVTPTVRNASLTETVNGTPPLYGFAAPMLD